MINKGWTSIAFDIKRWPVDSKNRSKQVNCCNKRSDCNHCMKKVLIIGGITKFKHLYEDLIESCGHKCVYLDGYRV